MVLEKKKKCKLAWEVNLKTTDDDNLIVEMFVLKLLYK